MSGLFCNCCRDLVLLAYVSYYLPSFRFLRYSYIWLTSTCQVIGRKDWVFTPVKWLVRKMVSEMTCSVSVGTSKPTLSNCLIVWQRFMRNTWSSVRTWNSYASACLTLILRVVSFHCLCLYLAPSVNYYFSILITSAIVVNAGCGVVRVESPPFSGRSS